MEPQASYPQTDALAHRDDRVRELLDKLAGSGHRITQQRVNILTALLEGDHPSAEEIFSAVQESSPNTSLATVYKTLQTLKEIGEVIEIEFSEGSNRYDGMRPATHPHIICKQCGRIDDVELPGLVDLNIRASEQSGYLVDTHRIDFYGLCRECQSVIEPNAKFSTHAPRR